MKPTELERKTSKSKNSSHKATPKKSVVRDAVNGPYVVCVKSGGYVDLEPLKVYRVRKDIHAKQQGLLRVIDQSGEDYLYPASFFRPITAPKALFQLVKRSEST